MKERRKVDNNQRIRMIRIWSSIFSTIVILLTIFAAGVVRVNQVNTNKEDIEVIGGIQKEDHDAIIEIRTTVKDMKEQLNRIENKL